MAKRTEIVIASAAFGRRLKAACDRVGVRQVELAALLGFRQDTLSRIMRGDAMTVPIDLLAPLTRWAISNNVSLAWLLSGDEQPVQKNTSLPAGDFNKALETMVGHIVSFVASELGK